MITMKIAFVDTLGLSYDGSTLSKRGLGGSESAVIRISHQLSKIGFEVTVFNDCVSDDTMPGIYDGVNYRPLQEVEQTTTDYDVLVASRSVATYAPPEIRNQFKCFLGDLPNFTNIVQRSKWRVLWMHDTFCDGDNLIEDLVLHGTINEIFTLSDWHTGYVSHCDHGKRRNFDILKNHIFMTRNGIGDMNPGWIDVRDKDPDLFVFNSSVTKGMVPLVTQVWPKIKQRIPQAKLTVIGGYYRFRSSHGPDQQEMDWRAMVDQYGSTVNFTGVIPQQEISDILRKASYMIYPAGFPETFGISTLEALAHNVPLITCRFAALEETAIDLASWKIPYPVEPNWALPWLSQESQVNVFAETVVNAYYNKYVHQQKMYACNQVKDICGWDTVALQWKQHFYKKLGQFLPLQDYRKVKKINTSVRKVFSRRFLNAEELVESKQAPFNMVTVVTPVYNAENYIDKCILSVAQQDYDNYRMIIVDDASTDNTISVAQRTIESLSPDLYDKFRIVSNETNMGAVYNQIRVAGTYDGIIMMLDGDDWLINDPTIFDMYNNIYNEGAEFTYGSCWSLADNIPLISQEYPPEIKESRKYRDYKFNWNMPYTHLRTFRGDLLHSYLHDHGDSAFKDSEGNWLRAGGDTSIFYSLIEYADPDKVKCVPHIVYNYNDMNPINDYKVNALEQTTTANRVLDNSSPFTPGQIDLRPL